MAELTLTLVLFTDASRLNLRALRQDYPLPARLLGVGLPLTIGLGAVAAKTLFGGLTWLEVGLVGVILAPTDAAWGKRWSATRGSRSASARASTSRAGSTMGSACLFC